MSEEDGSGNELPDELFSCIAENFDEGDENSMALAMSGACQGYSLLFGQDRSRHGLNISHKCYFLTPSSWASFFTQYILPESITKFSANHTYWLPAGQLASNICLMVNTEDLSIRDTQLTFGPHLNGVFKLCHKITKLDMSYQDEKGLLQDAVNFPTSTREAFKKFTSLQLSADVDTLVEKKTLFCNLFTRYHNDTIESYTYYYTDPWPSIIQILSCCQECSDLAIEINLNGGPFHLDNDWVVQIPGDERGNTQLLHDLRPKLEWMTGLRSLVLIKRRPLPWFRSPLLDELLSSLFPNDQDDLPYTPTLRNFWLQDFTLFDYTNQGPSFDRLMTAISPVVKSLRHGANIQFRVITCVPEGEPSRIMKNIENAGEMTVQGNGQVDYEDELHLGVSYPNLKYANVNKFETFQETRFLDHFLLHHPNLEHLVVKDKYVPSSIVRLTKLKVLGIGVDCDLKEPVKALSYICPNIEKLFFLDVERDSFEYEDVEFVQISKFVLGLNFKNLSSLSLLRKFDMEDGSFLLSIIKQCPKLKVLHLNGVFQRDNFLVNLGTFLEMAVSLRDLRLEWEYLCYEATGISTKLFNALKESKDLTRLVLIARSSEVESGMTRLDPEWITGNPNIFFQELETFVLAMKRLICLCLVESGTLYFPDSMASHMVELITNRIILPTRPALYFYTGSVLPKIRETPAIHFQEIIDPINSIPLPDFSI